MNKILIHHCSEAYHELIGTELGGFATNMKDQQLANIDIFDELPKAPSVIEGLITLHLSKYEAWQKGGINQKGESVTATKNLMDGMDENRVYVDKKADGSEEIIIQGGYDVTSTARTAADMCKIPTNGLGKHGTPNEILTECDAMAGATAYGCFCSIDEALDIVFEDGKIKSITAPKGFTMDVNKERKKSFGSLIAGRVYFFQYYCSNAAGVTKLGKVFSFRASDN